MRIRLVVYIFLMLFISGCAKETKEESAAVEESATASPLVDGEGAEDSMGMGTDSMGADMTDGAGTDGSEAGDYDSAQDDSDSGGEGSPVEDRVIYFEYDSSEVLPQYRSIVEAHAAHLASNPSAVVTLEGHADERGSREYNIALGERRAYAVKSQMTLLGAGDNQITVVSYGEERPAIDGHDESAWSKNRRVEIRY